MLLSMTGHGESHLQRDGVAVAAEVRTINNRYLKLNFRLSEGYTALEPRVETVVRKFIRRGTVQVDIKVDREPTGDEYRLNAALLGGVRRQLESLADRQLDLPPLLPALLALPGMVEQRPAVQALTDAHWPLIEEALTDALQNLAQMRAEEGRAMAVDLADNARTINGELDDIEARAPSVVDSYRERLTERINKLLGTLDVEVKPADLIREVGIFAERSDISEEVVRLRSHLEQYEQILQARESNGRKLEFVTQEMLRETNTIGSKANDAQIARHVIEIKACIERMREMIQNVE